MPHADKVGNAGKAPGSPEPHGKRQEKARAMKGYSETRVGTAPGQRDMDPVAGSTKQVNRGKESPNVPGM